MAELSEVTRDQARAALFRKGIIAPWYLYDYQKPLYNLFTSTLRDLIVPNISRRFGKSTVCVTYAMEQAQRKKQNIRYATAFLTDLENFIEPIFHSVLEYCAENDRPVWIASKKIWRFKNGSVIKLVGLDKNVNGLRGNAIDLLIVDEAAFVSNLEYQYKSVIIPATMKRKFKLIFPSTPPQSPEHFWAKELIPLAKQNSTYLELTIDDIDDLSEEEKNRLFKAVGGKHSVTAQREFYCKIVVDATRAIAPDFDESRHVGTVDHERIRWTYAGDSGGVKDKTVILKVGYSHVLRKTLIASELVYEAHTATPIIAAGFKAWSGDDSLVLDATGQVLIDWASLGIKAAFPAKDDFTAGIQMVNALFYNNELLIDQSCKLLITTLLSGLLTANKKDFERSDSLGHCDAFMALVYAIRSVDKVSDLREKPRRETVFTPSAPKNPLSIAWG
jgi:hypothetical protein